MDAAAALRAGEPIVLPTDTVYGLCAAAHEPEPTERLYRLKGRDPAQPSALLAADLDTLLECLPELRGRGEAIARTLLPGAYTLILPNPARRYPWLTGSNPDAIGVRVATLPAAAAPVLAALGAVVATSANRPGEPEPRRVEDVPQEFREAAGAVVDAGELPGRSSTVIDFTGPEPRVLREGAGSVEQALSAIA
ncbi:MAG TPA: L-threonylcarbamoyladenylate synthase [Gaiellaceae bacterium]